MTRESLDSGTLAAGVTVVTWASAFPAITVGLRMLRQRHLVDETDGLFRARPQELTLLAYYANSISHLLDDKITVQ